MFTYLDYGLDELVNRQSRTSCRETVANEYLSYHTMC